MPEWSPMPASKLLPDPARDAQFDQDEHALVFGQHHSPQLLTTILAKPAFSAARRNRRRQRKSDPPLPNRSLAIALSWIPSGPLTFARFSASQVSASALSISTTPTSTTNPSSCSEATVAARGTGEKLAAYGPEEGRQCGDDNDDEDDDRLHIGSSGRTFASQQRPGRAARIDGEEVEAAGRDLRRQIHTSCDGTRVAGRGRSTLRAAGVSGSTPDAPPSSYPDANAVFVLLIDAARDLFELLAVTYDKSNHTTLKDYIQAATMQSTLPRSQATAGCSSCFRMRTPASYPSSSSLLFRLRSRRSRSERTSDKFSERAVWNLQTPSTAVLPREVLVAIPEELCASKALHLARKILFKSPVVASILTQAATDKASSERTHTCRPEEESKESLPTKTSSATDAGTRPPRAVPQSKLSRSDRPPLCPRNPCFAETPTAVLQDKSHRPVGGRGRPRRIPCDDTDYDKENRPNFHGLD